MSKLENNFNKIVEKVVLYFNTLYNDDIEYHNEYTDTAFNYKYIKRKLALRVFDKNADDIKLNLINIIDSEIPDRLFDDDYYEIVDELTEWRGYDEDEYFEDTEDTEDGHIINYEVRYNVNVMDYLELFINNNETKEFINNMLDILTSNLK
jgi:hypothetical protein